ncbi:hypothetical protein KIN20_003864 [Parelaphostrongylus tenuis]|uniref:Uncharacterized protein n=1 Tax=Parelaphostrongylus tenuis TaxID=148309 RepID=A0AAD5MIX4_PARTN|nr:hypothetical protein KIN20_003864 [Parelaphostrongylus tenuis]
MSSDVGLLDLFWSLWIAMLDWPECSVPSDARLCRLEDALLRQVWHWLVNT